MKVCAGIVLYNPDLKRLSENICSIINQVNEVILIDNASDNSNEIQEYLEGLQYSVEYVRNDHNGGIAKALNEILDFASQNGYEYFITLDQDSVCNSELVENYKRIIEDGVAQVTCRIVDRENGEVDKIEFRGKHIADVDYCITSGCINSVSAIKRVGLYDESLFIDGVDIDISLRLKKRGFSIKKIDYEGIVHELGEKGEVNSTNKKAIKTSNHAPWRNYYARKNLIYIARKYYKGFEKHKRVWQQIIYGLGTILLEDKKLERIKFNVKGIFEGLIKPIK